MRHTTVLLRTCLFLFALGLVAAQTASPSVSIDDPELYYGFFSLRMQMQRDISGISSESYVSTAGERQASLAQYLHLSEADFVRAGDVAKAVLARVGGVVDTARGYRTEEIAGLKVPDRAKLQAYQQQRTTILQDGMKELQRTLSPQGWQALHEYINGKYRSSVVRKEVSHANN